MNRILFAALLTYTVSTTALAQAAPRDAIIDRAEAAFLSTTLFDADSPFIQLVLAPAIAANPSAPREGWANVARELSPAIAQTFAAKGSLVDTVFRASIEKLSDAELAQLERLLTDPIYRKFQAAMSSPQTQRQFLQAMMASGMAIMAALNTVLAKHGLQQVH